MQVLTGDQMAAEHETPGQVVAGCLWLATDRDWLALVVGCAVSSGLPLVGSHAAGAATHAAWQNDASYRIFIKLLTGKNFR